MFKLNAGSTIAAQYKSMYTFFAVVFFAVIGLADVPSDTLALVDWALDARLWAKSKAVANGDSSVDEFVAAVSLPLKLIFEKKLSGKDLANLIDDKPVDWIQKEDVEAIKNARVALIDESLKEEDKRHQEEHKTYLPAIDHFNIGPGIGWPIWVAYYGRCMRAVNQKPVIKDSIRLALAGWLTLGGEEPPEKLVKLLEEDKPKDEVVRDDGEEEVVSTENEPGLKELTQRMGEKLGLNNAGSSGRTPKPPPLLLVILLFIPLII